MKSLKSAIATIAVALVLPTVIAPSVIAAVAGTTERVSVNSSGGEGNGFSTWPAMSADGRYVAFVSFATNLVPGQTNNCRDIFVRDRQTGVTTLVSVATGGGQANNCSTAPSISADGRYVAFESDSDNLVPGDTNGRTDVFVHDRQTGTTTRVSVDSAGNQASAGSIDAHISADGRYVAFVSGAANLVAGDTNNAGDIFVHDRQTGAIERASVTSSGAEISEVTGGRPTNAISADGRYVAFTSSATNIDPRASSSSYVHIFLRDRQLGTTELVDINDAGAIASSSSALGAISGDGRFVAFATESTNLEPADGALDYDVFVRDGLLGMLETASVDSAGNPGNGQSFYPSISSDGRIVAFASDATNLAGADTNGAYDTFAHDRTNGATERISVSSAGAEANAASGFIPAINSDGRFVAFGSEASNLVPDDTNDTGDVFLRDRQGSTPASIVLTPPDAVNNVGTSHTVTATVRNSGGSSVGGTLVRFSTSGSTSTSGSCVTDAAGQCSFSYAGPLLPGADIISAYADANGDSSRQSTEPMAEATKAWILPTSTAGQTTGGGQVWNSTATDKVAFGYNAQSTGNGLKGNCEVVDPTPANNVKIRCLDVTALVQSGTHATFFGNATVNGTQTTYRIDVDDFGEPGAGSDTFRIVTGGGLTIGGTLTNGNIQIHN